MSETVILGGGGGRTNASTMILEGGSVEKPMLGRYQVEKELGKGAMGIVYKGHDPHIDRTVALKTVRKDLVDKELTAQFLGRFKN